MTDRLDRNKLGEKRRRIWTIKQSLLSCSCNSFNSFLWSTIWLVFIRITINNTQKWKHDDSASIIMNHILTPQFAQVFEHNMTGREHPSTYFHTTRCSIDSNTLIFFQIQSHQYRPTVPLHRIRNTCQMSTLLQRTYLRNADSADHHQLPKTARRQTQPPRSPRIRFRFRVHMQSQLRQVRRRTRHRPIRTVLISHAWPQFARRKFSLVFHLAFD